MMKTKDGVLLKPIPDSPNEDYMAGEDGNVYSRTKYSGFGRKDFVEWYALAGHGTKKGYRSISLCHNNVKVTKNVHRLICSAFHGRPASPSLQVRHLDGNPSNNCPSNLCWGTQAENWMDRKAHGHGMEGEKHHQSKLTDEERQHILWAISRGLCSRHHVARVLGMSQSAISSLARSLEA